jgi:putative transcriptional regulator
MKERTMSRKAFEKIEAGLKDAIAFAEGDTSRGRVTTPLDVRAIRAMTKLTQEKFAETYRLPVATLRDWEQNRRQPDAPARVLLSMIEAEPEAVEKLIARATG